MQMGIPLGKYINEKMYRGIVTGFNEAFIIDHDMYNRLVAADPRSTEILKPYLRGRDISRYSISNPNLWIIFTRQGIDIDRYPAIKAYLEQFRERLEPRPKNWPGDRAWTGRKPGPYKWYEIQDTVDYYSVFGLPKIIYPEMAPSAEYVYDTSSAYIDCTLFCIPNRQNYLAGVLNSKVLDYLLLQISPAIRGDFHRYKRIYLERLPIIDPSTADQQRLAELVDQLQSIQGQGPQVPALEREIDAIVYSTYGLAPEEIAEIERWHAERHEQLTAAKGKKTAILADQYLDEEEEEDVMSNPINGATIPDKIDVAISFAGTERALAERLAELVRQAGFIPFYDQFYTPAIWGDELPVTLHDIYSNRSRFCVIFISQEYINRPWTNHERRSALERAIRDKGQTYILPIVVDEGISIPGFPSTIAYLSLKQYSIEQIADILIQKLRIQP
jgi:hypothetical protein